MSGEANSFAYLTQRLSVSVQCGNAVSVLGTMKVDSDDEEFKFCCIIFFMLVWYKMSKCFHIHVCNGTMYCMSC